MLWLTRLFAGLTAGTAKVPYLDARSRGPESTILAGLSMAQSYGSFCFDNAWRRVLIRGAMDPKSRANSHCSPCIAYVTTSHGLELLYLLWPQNHSLRAYSRERQNGVCRKLCLNIMPPGRVTVVGSSVKYASTLCPSGFANRRKGRFSNQTSQSHSRKRRIVQFQTETSRRGLFCTLLSCFLKKGRKVGCIRGEAFVMQRS